MAMAKKTLNDRIIKALKPAPTGQRRDLWDALVPGFGIRSSDKGNHNFVLLARFPGSTNPTRRVIAPIGALGLAEARERARHWLALIGRGIDPQIEVERQRASELRKQADTFEGVCEKFFVSRKFKAQRRHLRVERIIRRELLPHWGGRPVTDITHRDLRALMQTVADRAPTYAFNVYDCASAVLNFAADHDLIEISPARMLKRSAILGAKKHRERVLNDTELRAFWRASGRLDYPFAPFFRLMLLTGARLNELGGARWREFDLEARTWTIPAERFKSDAEHMVPLCDDAMAILKALPRFTSGDYLFSTEFGRKPVSGFSKAKERLDQYMLSALQRMAESNGASQVELVPFVSHDLRRTVRTRLSALQVAEHVAEAVIGHGRKGLARVYDQHRYETEKREALDRWMMLLRSIIEPPPANVVTLPRRTNQRRSSISENGS
jgi:integrase